MIEAHHVRTQETYPQPHEMSYDITTPSPSLKPSTSTSKKENPMTKYLLKQVPKFISTVAPIAPPPPAESQVLSGKLKQRISTIEAQEKLSSTWISNHGINRNSIFPVGIAYQEHVDARDFYDYYNSLRVTENVLKVGLVDVFGGGNGHGVNETEDLKDLKIIDGDGDLDLSKRRRFENEVDRRGSGEDGMSSRESTVYGDLEGGNGNGGKQLNTSIDFNSIKKVEKVIPQEEDEEEDDLYTLSPITTRSSTTPSNHQNVKYSKHGLHAPRGLNARSRTLGTSERWELDSWYVNEEGFTPDAQELLEVCKIVREALDNTSIDETSSPDAKEIGITYIRDKIDVEGIDIDQEPLEVWFKEMEDNIGLRTGKGLAETSQGFSPFYLFTIMGRKDLTEMLIREGANINDVTKVNLDIDESDRFELDDGFEIEDDGNRELTFTVDITALHLCILYEQEEMVKMLVANGADLRAEIRPGVDCMVLSALCSSLNMIRTVISVGASLVKLTSPFNMFGHTTRTSLTILEKLDEDDTTTEDEIVEMLETLAAAGCRLPEQEDNDYQMCWLLFMCVLMFTEGQNKIKEEVNEWNFKQAGITFRKRAIPAAVELKSTKILNCLLMVGLDVNSRNANGKTALDIAWEDGDRKTAQLLLDYGANFSSQ